MPKFSTQQVNSLPTTQSSNSVLSLTRVPFRFVIQAHAAKYTNQTLTVFLGFGWINGAFALTIRMASSQRMVFDEKLGKLVPWKPTYQEFARNPESYPEFEATMNYETGQLEVTPKKEAEKNPDRQIMTDMVQQGFFLPAWNSFFIDGTL